MAKHDRPTGPSDPADLEILNAFNSKVNYAIQKDRNKSCAPGTECARPAIVVLTAEAGGGKSTVMKTLVDRLLERSEPVLAAYFFFKDDADDLRSYGKALSSLIYQLLVQEKKLVEYAREVHQRYGDGLKNDTKAMLELLSVLSQKAEKDVYCVLDAVDECEAIDRNQLLADLKSLFSTTDNSASRLKIVVSSRPWRERQDSTEIFKVIQFKVQKLVEERELYHATKTMMVEKLFEQNRHTRSFLAVQMAFELLDSHHRMHKGAGERTVSTILSEIPQSLGSRFDALLDRSANKEHTWRLLCVILAARKTLKIDEFKVIYAITEPRDSSVSKAQSYDDLELPSDDDGFKRLVRSRCGLFITFVKNSVHLFHQTAREYLIERMDRSAEYMSPLFLQETSGLATSDKPPWKGSISLSDANRVCASMCLDILSFAVPKKLPFEIFDNMEAGNKIEEDFQDNYKEGFTGFISTRPFFTYAACNWHEHISLAGDSGFQLLKKESYSDIFDISKPKFWAWFLTLADCVCSRTVKKRPPVSQIWSKDNADVPNELGGFLRENCLKKIFPMDEKLRALLDLSEERFVSGQTAHQDQITWKTSEGFHFIDRFHLANGDYEYTSSGRAVEAFEKGDAERASVLLAKVPHHTLIWTAITTGAPSALRGALASSKDLSWLQIVPDHILYKRKKTWGWSSWNGKDLRKSREGGWKGECPPSFVVMLRVSMLDASIPVFAALADWIDRQVEKQLFAQQLWQAGDGTTGLHVACSFWMHDAIQSLVQNGADPARLTPKGYNALHCFFQHTKMPRNTYETNTESEQATYFFNKSRINKSIDAITTGNFSKESLLSRQCHQGFTPLMCGVRSTRSSGTAIKRILDRGAAPDQQDEKGRTALMYFFFDGEEFVDKDTSILKHLLHAGANPLALDMSGNSALSYWATTTASVNLDYLSAGFNTYNKSFHALANYGSLSFQDLAAELNRVKVPLVIASRLGNAQLCSALLAGGADPNQKGDAYASFFRGRRGNDPDEEPEENESTVEWNPLLTALQCRAYKTAAMLIEHGADINFELRKRKRRRHNRYNFDWVGTSNRLNLSHHGGDNSACFFHGGVSHDMDHALKDLVLLQMQYYKDPRDEDEEDSNPECEIRRDIYANDNRGANLLPYDHKQGVLSVPSNQRLAEIVTGTSSLKQQREGLVRYMLSKGASSNACTVRRMSLLMLAVKENLLSIVEILLEYGADPNVAEVGGATPLMVATIHNEPAIVERLLRSGANPNAQLDVKDPDKCKCRAFIHWGSSSHGACDAPYTALALAVAWEYKEVVELLLKHGADPNLKITHHAHGRLPSKQDMQRRKGSSCSSDDESDPEPEEWKGCISVGTALKWAKAKIREMLLSHGARSVEEDVTRECDCIIEPQPERRPWVFSDDDEIEED
uniref:NACHT domain-containing protein n=1 Tax=Bionectria ochroleuca TaxID=29856 RepID=A0A8H7N0K0_BIOOC